MPLDLPHLRNALRKLRALSLGDKAADHAMAPQEILDLLAAAAGIKPVCIVGRGFAPHGWAEGAVAVARGLGLHVLQAPFWKYDDGLSEDIAAALVGRGGEEELAFYITRSRVLKGETERLRDSGSKPTIQTEARLSGYPACCISHHRQSSRNVMSGFMMMLRRASGGDEAKLMDLIARDVSLSPETQEEERLLSSLEQVNPAPFTSINMCLECSSDPRSPARLLSETYRSLALKLDPDLVWQIESAHSAFLDG